MFAKGKHTTYKVCVISEVSMRYVIWLSRNSAMPPEHQKEIHAMHGEDVRIVDAFRIAQMDMDTKEHAGYAAAALRECIREYGAEAVYGELPVPIKWAIPVFYQATTKTPMWESWCVNGKHVRFVCTFWV